MALTDGFDVFHVRLTQKACNLYTEHEITAGHRPMADQRTLLADQMKRLHGHLDNTHMNTHRHGGLTSPISLVVLQSVSELEAEQNADPSCTYAMVNGGSYGYTGTNYPSTRSTP